MAQVIASLFLVGMISLNAWALPPCEIADQKIQDENAACISTAGVTFQRVFDEKSGFWGWLDTAEGGKIWLDPIKETYIPRSFYVSYLCRKDQNTALASVEDFALAHAHGLSEILKDMRERDFWTSTCTRNSEDSPLPRSLFSGCRVHHYSFSEAASGPFILNTRERNYEYQRCILM